MKVAVFGSAFNPPHLGHKDVIEQLLPNFDMVFLVPAFAHAFGKAMESYEHRCAMLEKFVLEFFDGDSRLIINYIEQDIAQTKEEGAPIYTWDVMTTLREYHENVDLSFVIGPDNKAVWNKFYKADDIEQEFELFYAEERKPMRSTLCRTLLNNELKEVVGDAVADYIMQHQLYAYEAY